MPIYRFHNAAWHLITVDTTPAGDAFITEDGSPLFAEDGAPLSTE